MSSRVGKPGTPHAITVNRDSVTLTWTPSSRVEDTSPTYQYLVLYRKLRETHFIIHPSHGTMTTCYISGLSPDVDYEFKVRVSISDNYYEDSGTFSIKTMTYHDIVLIGKTGFGKSTLGNKLLNLEATPSSKIYLFESEDPSSCKQKSFVESSDPGVTTSSMHSVTEKCKLLANSDSSVRILDVPGFSDSCSLRHFAGKNVSVLEGNLQIIRWVVRAQIRFKLQVRHIVYFLPVRGPLEKADGSIQEEVRVLYHFFGREIFDCMVLAATNHKRQKTQNLVFDEDDYSTTRQVFQEVLNSAISEEQITCPPIIYIAVNEKPSECLKKIVSALESTPLTLQFHENTCARCSVKIHCTKDKEKVEVMHSNGTCTPYRESKCHPKFIRKYTKLERGAGGTAHVLTFGIPYAVGKVTGKGSWPGFFNSDEVCKQCKMSPGVEGCTTVTEGVDHSNSL